MKLDYEEKCSGCDLRDENIDYLRGELDKTRGELSTLRKSRNHASSYLDCSGRLKIACEALKHIMDTENISQPGDPFESYSLRVAREALTKIGELK